MKLLEIFIIFLVVVIADFMLWKRWREEYSDDEIFIFSIFLGLVAIFGGIIASLVTGGKLAWGLTGWGAMATGYLAVIWWCRMRKWQMWETMDSVTPIFAWLWALASLYHPSWQTLFAWLGLGLVAYVRVSYRNWHWYKSGKTGIVGLAFLAWFALEQITVAFVTPIGIYWGGLKAGQWLGAYLLGFVAVAIYLRSGRKLKV